MNRTNVTTITLTWEVKVGILGGLERSDNKNNIANSTRRVALCAPLALRSIHLDDPYRTDLHCGLFSHLRYWHVGVDCRPYSERGSETLTKRRGRNCLHGFHDRCNSPPVALPSWLYLVYTL